MEFESNENITVLDDELYFLDDTIDITQPEIFFTSEVGSHANGRIDQFAAFYLGDSRFADVLAEFNEMEDMTDIEKGDLIFIPFNGSWRYTSGSVSLDGNVKDLINSKISAKLPNRKRTETFIREGGKLTF